jgi:hypothetical protein
VFFRQGKVGFPFSKRPETERNVNRRMIGHLLKGLEDD